MLKIAHHYNSGVDQRYRIQISSFASFRTKVHNKEIALSFHTNTWVIQTISVFLHQNAASVIVILIGSYWEDAGFFVPKIYIMPFKLS